MTASLADLGNRYFFNLKTIERVVEVLDDADWGRRPSEAGGNDAHWILGHLATSRRFLLRRIGVDVEEAPWEPLFGMRAQPDGHEGYPPPSALLETMHADGKRLTARLTEMTEEEAATDWGGKFPDGGSTWEGAARFLYFHESYHIGQLGLLRRISGKPGFA